MISTILTLFVCNEKLSNSVRFKKYFRIGIWKPLWNFFNSLKSDDILLQTNKVSIDSIHETLILDRQEIVLLLLQKARKLNLYQTFKIGCLFHRVLTSKK